MNTFAILLSVTGFFRFAIIILAIYFIVKGLRLLFVLNNQYRSGQNANQAQKTGETTLHFNEKGEKIIDKNQGEFVDFEEVE